MHAPPPPCTPPPPKELGIQEGLLILERTLVCVGAKRKRGCSLVPESLKNWLVSIDLWCHTILHTYQNASQKKTRPPVPNMGPGPAGPIFFFN